jgi:hypothetical protein
LIDGFPKPFLSASQLFLLPPPPLRRSAAMALRLVVSDLDGPPVWNLTALAANDEAHAYCTRPQHWARFCLELMVEYRFLYRALVAPQPTRTAARRHARFAFERFRDFYGRIAGRGDPDNALRVALTEAAAVADSVRSEERFIQAVLDAAAIPPPAASSGEPAPKRRRLTGKGPLVR